MRVSRRDRRLDLERLERLIAALPASDRRRNSLTPLDLPAELRREIVARWVQLSDFEKISTKFRLHQWLIRDVVIFEMLRQSPDFRPIRQQPASHAELDCAHHILSGMKIGSGLLQSATEVCMLIASDLWHIGSSRMVAARFHVSASSLCQVALLALHGQGRDSVYQRFLRSARKLPLLPAAPS
jgi:hypothetical protein